MVIYWLLVFWTFNILHLVCIVSFIDYHKMDCWVKSIFTVLLFFVPKIKIDLASKSCKLQVATWPLTAIYNILSDYFRSYLFTQFVYIFVKYSLSDLWCVIWFFTSIIPIHIQLLCTNRFCHDIVCIHCNEEELCGLLLCFRANLGNLSLVASDVQLWYEDTN